jgi:hypothetical protein
LYIELNAIGRWSPVRCTLVGDTPPFGVSTCEKPPDLPVQQLTRSELTINLATYFDPFLAASSAAFSATRAPARMLAMA